MLNCNWDFRDRLRSCNLWSWLWHNFWSNCCWWSWYFSWSWSWCRQYLTLCLTYGLVLHSNSWLLQIFLLKHLLWFLCSRDLRFYHNRLFGKRYCLFRQDFRHRFNCSLRFNYRLDLDCSLSGWFWRNNFFIFLGFLISSFLSFLGCLSFGLSLNILHLFSCQLGLGLNWSWFRYGCLLSLSYRCRSRSSNWGSAFCCQLFEFFRRHACHLCLCLSKCLSLFIISCGSLDISCLLDIYLTYLFSGCCWGHVFSWCGQRRALFLLNCSFQSLLLLLSLLNLLLNRKLTIRTSFSLWLWINLVENFRRYNLIVKAFFSLFLISSLLCNTTNIWIIRWNDIWLWQSFSLGILLSLLGC